MSTIHDLYLPNRYAGAILHTPDGRAFGQLRDDIEGIDNPGRIGTWGGGIDIGETPEDAVHREVVREETNLDLAKSAFVLLCMDEERRDLTGKMEHRWFYTAEITEQQLYDIEVYEGQGCIEVCSPEDPLLIDTWRPIFSRYFASRRGSRLA